jgi:hypothetical protein
MHQLVHRPPERARIAEQVVMSRNTMPRLGIIRDAADRGLEVGDETLIHSVVLSQAHAVAPGRRSDGPIQQGFLTHSGGTRHARERLGPARLVARL